jgi:RND superfamily putative drug exporter
MAEALLRAYATVVVALRWPIAIAWLIATAAAVIGLPPLSQTSVGSLGSIVPEDSPALAAERASAAAFGFPLFSRTILARRDARGLAAGEQAGWALAAARLDAAGGRRVRDREGETIAVAGAIPLVNQPPLAGATPERGTAALAYLLFAPSVSAADRVDGAAALRRGRLHPAHVTGVVPARVTAADTIAGKLLLVELATGLLVAIVVGLHFRAPGAPLAVLAVVTVSYLLAIRVLPWLAARMGLTAPQEVGPMIVVLLFGALTDYSIFLLTRCRARLAAGDGRTDAARAATRDLVPIVTVAALIVSAASAALVLARFGFFRAFGPGMAAAIAVGWAVTVTLLPALLAIFGRALFWPSSPGSAGAGVRRRRRLLAAVTRHPLAAALAVVAVLAVPAAGLARLRLADPAIRGLPAGADARAGYQDIAAGFGPGFVAPTLVVLRGDGLGERGAALARLQRELEDRRGVAAVLGPADLPLAPGQGALVARDGRTARLALVWAGDPLGAQAIARVRELRADLPGLLRRAGLGGSQALVGGDTALSADTISLALGDLVRVAPAVLLVVMIVLALYLRAIAVPLLLVAASTLGVAAALGGLAWAWGALSSGAIAYYVPFAVAVLLLGLGSDYSVLLIGRIWDRARERPAREAIVDAGARAARPINVAGLVLAMSFGLLAMVPLWEFRQFALAMAGGLLLDAFVVRPLLLPALVALVAGRGGAPARERGAWRRRERSRYRV